MYLNILGNLGFNFLSISKDYVEKTNEKARFEQAIKIIIFSATAAEAIANREGSEQLKGKKLKKFIDTGFRPPDHDNKSKIVWKWQYLLDQTCIARNKKLEHLNNLDELIKLRNKLVHFEPRKNTIRMSFSEKKQPKLVRNHGVYKIKLNMARKAYNDFDALFFDYCKAKRTYPHQEISNKLWGKRSPFWRS